MTDTSPERVAELAAWWSEMHTPDCITLMPAEYGGPEEPDDPDPPCDCKGMDTADLLSALAAERDALRDEVRKMQRWIHDLDDTGEVLCEDLCLQVCAGPCEGVPVGPIGAALNEGDDLT